jgi:hypothetical protein
MNLLKAAPEGAESFRCDFCNQAVVHQFEVQAKPCIMVAVNDGGESMSWSSFDSWCACPRCYDFIQARLYRDLLARCLLSLPDDIVSGMPLEVLIEMYSSMWVSCFGAGFMGSVSASDFRSLQSVGRVC